MSSARQLPPPPKNIAIRPLSKGMRLDLPSQMLEPGALIDVKNFIVGPEGLTRRPAFSQFTPSAVGYQPVQDLLSAWAGSGGQTTLLIDDKFVYSVSTTAITGIYSTYATGTITATASSTTVTGSGTLWNTAASNVQAGDVIVLDADGSGNGPEEIEISSITNDTSLELLTAAANNHAAGTDYEIRRALQANTPYLVDRTVVGPSQDVGGSLESKTYIVLADFNRGPFAYNVDDGTYAPYLTDTTAIIPATVEFFGQRLWAGHIASGANTYRQRIQWTSPLDRTRFDLTEPQTGYLDLEHTSGGAIRKLLSMGNLLIAYMEDGVWIGRPTNNINHPVRFDELETGGVGLVGLKAVAPFVNGHYFIGQDDIYFLSSRNIERIGTPIVKASIREAANLSRAYAVADPKNDRIVFGFPKSGEDMEEIFSYSYKTKSWSYDEISTTMLSDEGLTFNITWDTLNSFIGTNTWDAGMSDFASWDGIEQLDAGQKNLFYAQNGIVYVLETNGGSDAVGGTISAQFETGDLDFGLPDQDKFYNRVSLKLGAVTSTALSFTVTGSTNRGNSWKSLGTMTIAAGSDEGKLTFRMTGSIARFRFVVAANVDPFTITELVVRARAGGLETE